MGAYLCIASNGVHPSVSKRIKVSVDCEYNLVIRLIKLKINYKCFRLEIEMVIEMCGNQEDRRAK